MVPRHDKQQSPGVVSACLGFPFFPGWKQKWGLFLVLPHFGKSHTARASPRIRHLAVGRGNE